MICVSIGYKKTDEVIEILNIIDFAEIRFDLCDIPIEDLNEIYSSGKKIIAKYRQKDRSDDALRIKYLTESIRLGAKYIDLSPDTDAYFVDKLVKFARENDCRVILSHHNFEKIPDLIDINTIINDYIMFEPDIIKLVFKSYNISDNAIFKEIYYYFNGLKTNTKLICFGLGEVARQTRLESLKLGAPFLYAHPDGESKTAEGQYSYSEAKILINLNIKEK
jgi:3-dehydroquinate dehydratase-1